MDEEHGQLLLQAVGTHLMHLIRQREQHPKLEVSELEVVWKLTVDVRRNVPRGKTQFALWQRLRDPLGREHLLHNGAHELADVLLRRRERDTNGCMNKAKRGVAFGARVARTFIASSDMKTPKPASGGEAAHELPLTRH